MCSPISSILLCFLALAISVLPTTHAATCSGGDISLKKPRVTVGSDGALTLTGKVKFVSTSSNPEVRADVSVLGHSASLNVDLCLDVTCSDGSACPCTSWTKIAVDLGTSIPQAYAKYIPSGFSISANADIYQDNTLLTSCSVGVRSASASFVSVGAVVMLLGLGGAGLFFRRRRRVVTETDDGRSSSGPTSSFVEMADESGGGSAVLA
mmetsp:Transcript_1035/g.1792  ORF Transcript_1035/g.1792 Transcript_1035/m.1792 type:complete len:209 (-) Transcript_1035:124-750(-)